MTDDLRERLRTRLTNEVVRAAGSLARQTNVCREQDGKTVFVTGIEAAREYLIESIGDAALAADITRLEAELTETRALLDTTQTALAALMRQRDAIRAVLCIEVPTRARAAADTEIATLRAVLGQVAEILT